MLRLKLQYFGHLMRTDSFEKTLMLGKIEDRKRGQLKMRWLDGITDSMDMSLSKFQEMVKDRVKDWRAAWGCKKLDTTERLYDNNSISNLLMKYEVKCSCSVVSDSDTRLLHPWNFPGKSTRVACHFLLHGIFLTQD